ncbi:MAG: hypothetical protein M5R36_00970 [Deltaproteobacteria bacterium]|nr:hypothetical protein [Deltaproteobacteria bacterium]
MENQDKRRKLPGALFALVIGLGYLTALATLVLSHIGADGDPAFSNHDIVVSFAGDPKLTRLTVMVKGTMREHLKTEDELNTILGWVDAGALEKDFPPVYDVMDKRCQKCHNPFGKASFAPLTTYEEVAEFTGPNTGMSFDRLANLSHQHLFGMGLLVLALSLVLWFQTPFGGMIKTALVLLGFGGEICDIGGWWLMKLSPHFLYMTLAGGAMMGTFFGVTIALIWYDVVFGKGTWKDAS